MCVCVGSKTIDDAFYEREVELNEVTWEGQVGISVLGYGFRRRLIGLAFAVE